MIFFLSAVEYTSVFEQGALFDESGVWEINSEKVCKIQPKESKTPEEIIENMVDIRDSCFGFKPFWILVIFSQLSLFVFYWENNVSIL